jgi:hypothetical protein
LPACMGVGNAKALSNFSREIRSTTRVPIFGHGLSHA